MGLLLSLLRSAHRMATSVLPSLISMNSGAPSALSNRLRAAVCHGHGFFTAYASMIFSVALVFGLLTFLTTFLVVTLALGFRSSSLGAEP